MAFDGAYSAEVWERIAKENAGEADELKAIETAREKGERVRRAPAPPGAGAERGQADVAELLDGAWRLSRNAPKDWAAEPLGALDAPRVAVLLPAGSELQPHKLFDVPEPLLFLIHSPAGAPTLDALEGIAYALTELRVSALLVLGSTHAPELDTCARRGARFFFCVQCGGGARLNWHGRSPPC